MGLLVSVRIAASILGVIDAELRVDDHHALVADLHRRVPTGADEHVDAALHRPDVNVIVVIGCSAAPLQRGRGPVAAAVGRS